MLCLVALLVARPSPAYAWQPGWVTDLENEVKKWQDELDASLQRIKDKAEAAKQKASADLKQRIDQARQMLEDLKAGLKQVIAQQKQEWTAVIVKRLREVTAIAGELAADLDGIISGGLHDIRFQASRLATGVRGITTDLIAQAGAKLENAELVDGAVISQAVTRGRSQALLWGGVVAIGLGVLLAGVAVPAFGRRRLAFAIVAGIAAAGAVGAGIYLVVDHTRQATTPVALGVTTCPALGNAQALINRHVAGGPAPSRTEADPVIQKLQVCAALAADDSLADVVQRQLTQLHNPR
ncbi:MAG: OmpH family outer membrane protein [Deltaproteobacteria bacterium]|nr:MAG: OmpH family outer membrane protein [Deltaproteobacteria bacterium]